MTVTKEDLYASTTLYSNYLVKDKLLPYLIRTLFIAVYFVACILMALLIVSLVTSSTPTSGIVYAYAISSAIFFYGFLIIIWITNTYSRKSSNVLITDTHKYTITADIIRDETEFSAVETKTKGVLFCIENSKLYAIGAPHQFYTFPKSEIAKLAEKEELIQWLNSIKKETEQLTLANRSKHYRRFWLSTDRMSAAGRKMLYEDSSNRNKENTRNNTKSV